MLWSIKDIVCNIVSNHDRYFVFIKKFHVSEEELFDEF